MAEDKKYYSIITDAGTAKMVLSIAEGRKVNLTKFAVGDGGGSYYQPTRDMMQLKGEKFRGNIKSYEIDSLSPNIAVIKAILPYSVGGWTVREMGVFDEDGILIGIGNMPDMEKVAAESGASYEMELTMRIAVSNIEQLEFKFDPVTILLTKRDLDAHDSNSKAHEVLFRDCDFGKKDRLLRIRRTIETNIPVLADGEPAFAIDSNKLFVGYGNKNIPIVNPPKVYEVQLPITEWTGTTAPYSQEVTIQGVTNSCLLVVSAKNQKEMIHTVSECVVTATAQRDNHVTFTADIKKPSIVVHFQVIDWGEVECQ